MVIAIVKIVVIVINQIKMVMRITVCLTKKHRNTAGDGECERGTGRRRRERERDWRSEVQPNILLEISDEQIQVSSVFLVVKPNTIVFLI